MNRRGRRSVSTRLRNESSVKGGRNERGRVALPSISRNLPQKTGSVHSISTVLPFPEFFEFQRFSIDPSPIVSINFSRSACKFYRSWNVRKTIASVYGSFQPTITLITVQRLSSPYLRMQVALRRTRYRIFLYPRPIKSKLLRNRFPLLRFITRNVDFVRI